MTASLEDAIALAAKQFDGTTDKSGQPYILHCIRVMMGVSDLETKIVAVLHDVVEDTDVSLDDLRELGFSETVVQGVDLMTHRPDVPYSDYVVRLKPSEIARAVKLSDLKDNLSISRVLLRSDRIDRDQKRIIKYLATHRFLTDEIDEATYRAMIENE